MWRSDNLGITEVCDKSVKKMMCFYCPLSFHKQTEWPISFVINLNVKYNISSKIQTQAQQQREGISWKVLSKIIIIQSALLYRRSEETAQAGGEMNGHGGALVYHRCVCVQGDMMDVCSNRDSRCCLYGRGIIECEGFFSRWVLHHPRIRTLIYQNCGPERQHQVAEEQNWLSSCSLCLINDATMSTLLSHYCTGLQIPRTDSYHGHFWMVKTNMSHRHVLSSKQ